MALTLTCSASTVMPNKASPSSSSLGGSVPRSVFFTSPLRTCSKPSLAVRAQQYGAPQYGTPQYGTPQYGAPQYGAPQYGAPTPKYGSEPFSTPSTGVSKEQAPTEGLVHTPWYTTEDERAIKMRIDMPGLGAEDIDVKVEGNMLVIKDLGRQIFSPYDTRIQLPTDCVKEQVDATLKNGVLHVSVPKKLSSQVVHIPVKTNLY